LNIATPLYFLIDAQGEEGLRSKFSDNPKYLLKRIWPKPQGLLCIYAINKKEFLYEIIVFYLKGFSPR
jgi:hypothetical protein